MKLNHLLTLCGTASILILTSCCGNSAKNLKTIREYEYQRGLAAGQAAHMRQQYHEEQQAQQSYNLGNAVRPPVKRRYYEVPIPEHTASDGVLIEAHTQKIEVIQPS